jgi:hypothetical protein
MRLSWLVHHMWGPAEPAADARPHSVSRSYRLESALPAAPFSATIQAWWLPADPTSDWLVFQHLLEEGSAVSRRFSVLDVAAANDALNATFAVKRMIPHSNVQVVATRAELGVGKDQLAFAEQKAAIELRASIDAAEMDATYARLSKLRDLFLSDSAMAGLWWSQGEPDRMLHLAENSGKLDSIVSTVAASHAGPVQEEKIASLIGRFLEGLGPSHREWLIGQLAKVFESYQQPGLAEEMFEVQQGG